MLKTLDKPQLAECFVILGSRLGVLAAKLTQNWGMRS